MNIPGALFLTLSTSTPASSMFVIVPDVISEAGSGAGIAMGIAGLIALCMAGVYAELASAFPHAGGEYAMTALTLGPLPGFVMLGLNLMNTLFGAAVLALGVGTYLGAAIPGIEPAPAALATVVLATGLGVLNIRTNALITGLFVGVELAALLVLAVLGFAHPARGLEALLLHPVRLVGGVLGPVSPAALGVAISVSVFAFDGYGAAAYLSEETRSARVRIAKAILAAFLVTAVAEAVPLVGVLVGAPDLKALLAAERPFNLFTVVRGGRALETGVSLAVALAIVNAVIAMVLIIARQLYATGRDGTWGAGANRLLTAVHPRFRSPWGATLTAGGLTAGLCFVDLKLLLIATGAGAAGVYAVLCLAALAGRRTGSTARAAYRMPLFPWVPLGALLALIGVFAADAADPAEGRPGLLVGVMIAALFAAYYGLVLKNRRGWAPRLVEEAG
jgi:amino acid transporter